MNNTKQDRAGKIARIMMEVFPDEMAKLIAHNSMSLEYEMPECEISQERFDEMIAEAKKRYNKHYPSKSKNKDDNTR